MTYFPFLRHLYSYTAAFGEATLLSIASKEGDIGFARFLLSVGYDVNEMVEPEGAALHWALKNGHPELALAYIDEYKANPELANAKGTTPLHLAAYFGYTPVVEYLFAKQAHANTPNKAGVYPLHFAVEQGHEETALRILKQDRAILREKGNGYSTLHAAAKVGMVAVVQELLHSGAASLRSPYNEEKTPIYYAVKYGQNEVVKFLVNKAGANAMQQLSDGCTMLHLAVNYGHSAIAQILLNKGAETERYCPLSTDSETLATPLGMALLGNHYDAAALLVKYGADVAVAAGLIGSAPVSAAISALLFVTKQQEARLQSAYALPSHASGLMAHDYLSKYPDSYVSKICEGFDIAALSFYDDTLQLQLVCIPEITD